MKRIVNIDSLQPSPISARLPGAPPLYEGAAVAPIAPLVGARRLGYNMTVVPPGKAAFPFHSHYGNEEMFFILEGQGELRYGDGRHPLRAGDIVACPPGGPDSAHQIRNTSADAELRYLAVSTAQSPDMFHYPDSDKTGASHYPESGDVIRLRNRIDHNLDYWDGE